MAAEYKVLVDGRSAHGGDLAWSLPTDTGDGTWTPGDWHELAPPVVVCKRGLHLTTEPMRWARVGMSVYAAEGAGLSDTLDDKTAYLRARLLRPAPEMIADWWRGVERFVNEEIRAVPWFRPDGDPDPAWRLVTAPTWDAAWDAAGAAAWAAAWDAAWAAARAAARAAAGAAAWDAAWDAARDAAWDAAGAAAWAAARDAQLLALTEYVCAGLPLDERHRQRSRACWRVWQKGYGLYGEVDGVLVVYAAEART